MEPSQLFMSSSSYLTKIPPNKQTNKNRKSWFFKLSKYSFKYLKFKRTKTLGMILTSQMRNILWDIWPAVESRTASVRFKHVWVTEHKHAHKHTHARLRLVLTAVIKCNQSDLSAVCPVYSLGRHRARAVCSQYVQGVAAWTCCALLQATPELSGSLSAGGGRQINRSSCPKQSDMESL